MNHIYESYNITHILEKAIKLKQAKEEAKVEIAKFTKERESEFKVNHDDVTYQLRNTK